jgi:hypothetical protein
VWGEGDRRRTEGWVGCPDEVVRSLWSRWRAWAGSILLLQAVEDTS